MCKIKTKKKYWERISEHIKLPKFTLPAQNRL